MELSKSYFVNIFWTTDEETGYRMYYADLDENVQELNIDFDNNTVCFTYGPLSNRFYEMVKINDEPAMFEVDTNELKEIYMPLIGDQTIEKLIEWEVAHENLIIPN